MNCLLNPWGKYIWCCIVILVVTSIRIVEDASWVQKTLLYRSSWKSNEYIFLFRNKYRVTIKNVWKCLYICRSRYVKYSTDWTGVWFRSCSEWFQTYPSRRSVMSNCSRCWTPTWRRRCCARAAPYTLWRRVEWLATSSIWTGIYCNAKEMNILGST